MIPVGWAQASCEAKMMMPSATALKMMMPGVAEKMMIPGDALVSWHVVSTVPFTSDLPLMMIPAKLKVEPKAKVAASVKAANVFFIIVISKKIDQFLNPA